MMSEDMECKHRQVEILVKENERLKAALEDVSITPTNMPHEMQYIANRALEEAR